jgi:hypothetical protein
MKKIMCMGGGKFGAHKGTGHKKEESTRSKAQRVKYPKQRDA